MDQRYAPASVGPIVIVVFAVISLVVAAVAFHAYLANPDLLWADANHDRNSHFAAGQQIAIAIRTLNFSALIDALEGAKVWPPLNDIAVGLALAIGGIDHSLAIVPALIAWSATVVMAAVLAWRSLADHWQAATAAVVASALTLTSPTLRLVGADVLFELPGAALSAASLYLFGRAMDRPSAAIRWRWFALALTALFLTKYNYWLLCVVALIATSATLAPLTRTQAQRIFATIAPIGLCLGRALRGPVGISGILALALAAMIFVHGPTSIEAFGQAVSLYPPNNIITLGYALLLAALVIELRSKAAFAVLRDMTIARVLALWHGLPVALWLLLPDRIASIAWYLGPSHYGAGGNTGYAHVLAGAEFYWSVFVEGFHAAPEIGWAVAALFVLSLALFSRLTVTGRAVVIFALICVILVVIHPQRQARFLSHWLPEVWVAAGIGVAHILQVLVPRRIALLRLAGATMLSIALCAFGLSRPVSDKALAHASRSPRGTPSDLEITRAYLPLIDPSEPHAVIASFGRNALPAWVAREACECLVDVAEPWFTVGAVGDRAVVGAFLRSLTVDNVVVISIPDYPRPDGIADHRLREKAIAEALAAQTRFVPGEPIVSGPFGAVVTVWHRAGPSGEG